jgi:hypothetical protein
LPRQRRRWRCGCRSIVNRPRRLPPPPQLRHQAPLSQSPCLQDRPMNGRVTQSSPSRTRRRPQRRPLLRSTPLRDANRRLDSTRGAGVSAGDRPRARLVHRCGHAATMPRLLPRPPLRRLLLQRRHHPRRLHRPPGPLRGVPFHRRPWSLSSRRPSRKP